MWRIIDISYLLGTDYQIFTKWAIFSALEVVVVMESI